MSMKRNVQKRIHNGWLLWLENYVIQDNSSASLSKPPNAEQLSSWQNFLSAPLNLLRNFLYSSANRMSCESL